MACVRLAEIVGMLGGQADADVDPAEVPVMQAGQPGPDFRFDLHLVHACHAFYAICICCYIKAGAQVPDAMYAARM